MAPIDAISIGPRPPCLLFLSQSLGNSSGGTRPIEVDPIGVVVPVRLRQPRLGVLGSYEGGLQGPSLEWTHVRPLS